ncbi:MAG: helix-turn-helix domain-containing protein [Gammaproteobacteria bacterium]
MKVQLIEKNGKPEYAVLAFADYQKLLEEAEMLADIRAYDEAKARIAAGDDEFFPSELLDRLLSGEHPLKIWREYRGLTLAQLGDACGVSAAALSQIETGKGEPSVGLLKKLAEALRADMDALVPSSAP